MEFASWELERANRMIVTMAHNLALKHRLPTRVHILADDPELRRRYGANAIIAYQGEATHVTRGEVGLLRNGVTPLDIADDLIRDQPGAALLCDLVIAQELGRESLAVVADGHCRLIGRPHGILDVYTPYRATTESRALPNGLTAHIWLYRE